jgi:hypothetical protein
MSLVFNMPEIERTIFQYALRDVCLKEVIDYENTRDVSTFSKIHPKNSLSEARALTRCFAKKYFNINIALKWNQYASDPSTKRGNVYSDLHLNSDFVEANWIRLKNAITILLITQSSKKSQHPFNLILNITFIILGREIPLTNY